MTNSSLCNSTRANFRSRNGEQAFSLIEIVLALGVLAFAIIPLIGLLPHGSETLHIAIRQNAESRIQQDLLGKLSSADWSATNNLADFNNSTWMFDDQGNSVQSDSQTLYTAKMLITNPALPGADTANPYLATVTINITDIPIVLKPFDTPSRYRSYVSTLVKMDKVNPVN